MIFFFLMRGRGISMEDIGLPMIPDFFIRGFGTASVVSILTIGLVTLGERIHFVRVGTGNFWEITRDIWFANYDLSYLKLGLYPYLGWMALGVAICFLHTIFNEFFFRGLLFMHYDREVYSFAKVNLIQASLYTLWMVGTIVLSLALTGSAYPLELRIKIILLSLVGEFITGLKLGILRRVTGSLWGPLTDFFIIHVFNTMWHVWNSETTQLSRFERMVAISIITLVFYAIVDFVKKRWVIAHNDQIIEELIDEGEI
ncbi:MAG: hypothetical protein K6F09_00445 [Clostridiales bacterium]|nr:hypothetical protein [Clostridiales bacterium]